MTPRKSNNNNSDDLLKQKHTNKNSPKIGAAQLRRILASKKPLFFLNLFSHP